MKTQKLKQRFTTLGLTQATQWIPEMVAEVAAKLGVEKADLMRQCLMEGLAARDVKAKKKLAAWREINIVS